jgi:hypothetical protein
MIHSVLSCLTGGCFPQGAREAYGPSIHTWNQNSSINSAQMRAELLAPLQWRSGAP